MTFIDIALSQYGIKEISGDEDNQQIVIYARETGLGFIKDDETPWCSTFVNWCAKKAGLPMSGKANARSWLKVGAATPSPKPGDIVVFWRQSPESHKGHVGIFMGFNKNGKKVICLGGNQGDAVSIAKYRTKRVLDFRVIEEELVLSIPESAPILKKGSKGKEVIKLQLALNHLGYFCGDVDGDFGSKTRKALKTLQEAHLLEVDGKYGNESKQCIISLLQK